MNISFPLLLDGAMGTQLYKRGFPAGECPEKWSLEHPEEVLSICCCGFAGDLCANVWRKQLCAGKKRRLQ